MGCTYLVLLIFCWLLPLPEICLRNYFINPVPNSCRHRNRTIHKLQWNKLLQTSHKECLNNRGLFPWPRMTHQQSLFPNILRRNICYYLKLILIYFTWTLSFRHTCPLPPSKLWTSPGNIIPNTYPVHKLCHIWIISQLIYPNPKRGPIHNFPATTRLPGYSTSSTPTITYR